MRQDTSERKSCVLTLQHTYSLYEKNADLRSTQGHSGFWAAVHFHLWFIEQRTIQWQFLSHSVHNITSLARDWAFESRVDPIKKNSCLKIRLCLF